MINTLLFVILHFALSVLFFLTVQKPLFFIYNRSVSKTEVSRSEFLKIFLCGVKTDRIVAAYLTGVPVVVLLVLSVIPGADAYPFLVACDAVLAVIVSLAVVSDTALYRFWQFKLAASVLQYLRHPKGAFASVSVHFVLLAVVALTVTGLVFFGFMQVALLPMRGTSALCPDGWLWHILCALMLIAAAGVLFINIRGLGIRPNNPAVAYFSPKQFLNHCALNPLYNFIYSMSLKDEYRRGFRHFDHDECAAEFARLFPEGTGTPREVLRTRRPNILLIVWESLSARYISTLGGESGVMPNMERLSREGVLFSRCDAGSFRTDRGLVCVLGGLPGQPTESVIRYSSILPKLPAIPRVLRDAGYETTAVHGGDCFIMHKADWYLASGHDTLVQQKDLPDVGAMNRWGYHDGGVLNWLYDDIQAKTQAGKPWFTTLQTLSSHEPFDVPFHKHSDMKKNAFAYVDDCFGRFIDRLKASPAWNDLLVIVTGDHGFNYCEPLVRETYTHIPVLWLGGAVKEPFTFDRIMAQTDIAATLLGQLGLPHGDFKFSRDVLADTYKYPFALHTYNNGFLFRDETGFTDYDNVSGHALKNHDEAREHKGKVILQTLYEYLAEKE